MEVGRSWLLEPNLTGLYSRARGEALYTSEKGTTLIPEMRISQPRTACGKSQREALEESECKFHFPICLRLQVVIPAYLMKANAITIEPRGAERACAQLLTELRRRGIGR